MEEDEGRMEDGGWDGHQLGVGFPGHSHLRLDQLAVQLVGRVAQHLEVEVVEVIEVGEVREVRGDRGAWHCHLRI